MFKEGVLLDSSLHTVLDQEKSTLADKVVEREQFSNYVYPPLRRSFRSFVRIVAYVHLAVRKFKAMIERSRLSCNLPISDGSTMESLSLLPTKFAVFSAISDGLSSGQSLCIEFNK